MRTRINDRQEGVADDVARLKDGRGLDVVFDATGGDGIASSFAAAPMHGHAVTIASRYAAGFTHARRGLSLHVVLMLIPVLHDTGREAPGGLLRKAAAHVDAGKLRPLVDPKRFALEGLRAGRGRTGAHTIRRRLR